MKIRQKQGSIKSKVLAILLVVCTLLPLGYAEDYKAASSYSNAKEIYESINSYEKAEAYNGDFYLATMAKLASSSYNLKYHTLGFDITLSGNGASVSFAVVLGSSIEHIPSATVDSNGYQYNLYKISTNTLRNLAMAATPGAAQQIFSGTTVNLVADAIMTTKKGGAIHGSITENGWGGVYEEGTVYHLRNSAHLNKMLSIFSGHKFESFIDIDGRFNNFQLSILYSLGDGATVGNAYSLGAYTAENKTVTNVLYVNGSGVHMDRYRMFQQFSLLNPALVGLSKTGYHLESGKEWRNDSGYVFSSSQVYMPKTINPVVGYRNAGTILYANWKANTYTITYNANGGKGTVQNSYMTYDTPQALRNNTFTRTGYYLPAGKEWIDIGTGKTYGSGENVSNLTSANGDTITLYANWEPCVFMITANKEGGTNGTGVFYEKYESAFSLTNTFTSTTSKISIPTMTGYNFLGYYRGVNQGGSLIADALGNIKVSNSYFDSNATIYASWEAKKFNVAFDKQGGEHGTNSVIATYAETFPLADAPVKTGYTFMGYYTEPNGGGTCIYNQLMTSDIVYKYTNDITLYAYWVDITAPDAVLNTSYGDWTNQPITLTARATDLGVGLDHIEIYRVEADGSLVKVAHETNLNGALTGVATFVNDIEGVVRYKTVATDINGNSAESYNVVYYDITAPTGDVIEVVINGTTFYFKVDVTDTNTGD